MLDSNSTMATDNKKTKKKKSNSKPSDTVRNENAKCRKILLRSIAAFLEVNGFNKTLSMLRSEAPIAGDDLNMSSIDIEDLICKFLESSNVHEEAAIDWRKDADLGKINGSKKDESEQHGDASKHAHKKKRKHRKEVDYDTSPVAEEHGLDDNSNEVKDLEILKSAEDMGFEIKDKKKKKKSQSLSLEENTDKNHLEISRGMAENVDHDNILPDTDVNGKAKKKKKQKKSADGFNKNNESEDHNKIQEIVEEKEQNSLTNASSTLHVESNANHKGEKKRKRKAEATLASLAGNGENHTKVECESTKEKAAASKNDDTTDTKAHKKRKRLESEEEATHVENGTKAKGPKHDKLQAASPQEQDPSAQDVQKDQSACQLAEDDVDGNENEGETRSKSKKRGNHSAEPKTVNAFQRVKIDNVKFADERLQDNSYWALDGTGSGYGAKAQEVLGQVRGRDFRHEKTKKKRGSYRGGQIDLQSHSIKFNYSDEE